MPFFGRSRDDNLKTYIGFAAMSSVVLTIVGLSVDVYVRELRGMMLGVVAIALLLGILYRAGIRYWVALACGVLTSALIVFGGAGEVAWHDAPAMLGVVLSINLLLMLYAFRTHPSCYVGLAAAVGAMIGIASTNFWVGLVAFTAFIITLAILNYMAQLVLDHRAEMRQVPGRFLSRGTLVMAPRILLIWLPALALAGAGFCVNQWAQLQLKQAAYNTELVLRDGSNPLPVSERELESDVGFTLDQMQGKYTADFDARMDAAKQDSERKLIDTPQAASNFMEGLRPGEINSHNACKNAQTRVLRKTISFRGMCRDVVDGVNGLIQSSFNNARDKTQASINDKVAQGQSKHEDFFADVHEEGRDQIKASFDGFRTTARFAFVFAAWLVYVSYLLLVVSLVAALQMITGRILFHHGYAIAQAAAPAGNKKATLENLTFQLEQDGNAQPLVHEQDHELILTGDMEGPENKQYWYVHLPVSRRGKGTYMNVRVPQPLSCLFQRIFSGRYFLTRVDVGDPAVKQAKGKNAPRLSVAGDTKLVRIQLQPHQRICFRMSDLVAFTHGVKFKSVYSTYVGLHLLGLGSFYTTVQGEGFLVLKTEGEQVSESVQNQSTPPANLLAWDHAQSFSLAQRISVTGIWFNEPSLILSAPGGGAILDESGSDRFPIAVRIWRLFRYLFMPV